MMAADDMRRHAQCEWLLRWQQPRQRPHSGRARTTRRSAWRGAHVVPHAQDGSRACTQAAATAAAGARAHVGVIASGEDVHLRLQHRDLASSGLVDDLPGPRKQREHGGTKQPQHTAATGSATHARQRLRVPRQASEPLARDLASSHSHPHQACIAP